MSNLTDKIGSPKKGLARLGFARKHVGDDAGAAVVLGVESIPDGLAGGILAGVNPVSGLYAYMYGAAFGALFTSTAFMTIQGTGAMAIIVSDVDLDASDDPTRALVTLSMMTGVAMIIAGVLKLGRLLKFVSNSVMVGFLTAVGINIALGQAGNLTGYDSDASGKVIQVIDTLLSPGQIDIWTTITGLVTIALIIVLRKTRLQAMGMVVAIILGSALGVLFNSFGKDVELLGDVAEVPNRLPTPQLPLLSAVPELTIAALSLAFVALVQGAGVTAAFARPGEGDEDQDMIGQGAGSIGAGTFTGLPAGGSLSGTALIKSAGAKSRFAIIYAGIVMGLIILLFARRRAGTRSRCRRARRTASGWRW